MVDDIAVRERLSESALLALRTVPRHRFVPREFRAESYENHPLPIGEEQTISQPFMVAWLGDAVGAMQGRRILEIGTGCGYQAAVLAEMGAEVWSIEIRAGLARSARALLDGTGYSRVQTRIGDGCSGWMEMAPFDGVVLTAAPEQVPDSLFAQVAEGGVLVAPVGPQDSHQELVRWRRSRGGTWDAEPLGGVRFVPLVQERR
jgi:protein-L-isoaspartate(D-aspartate) O-methyltransferase